MKKKRKLEILEDFIDKFDFCFKNGICESFAIYYEIFHNEHLTFEPFNLERKMSLIEYLRIRLFLLQNLPEYQKSNNYCWRKGLKKPRIEFLEQLKTKYENKKS